MNVLHAQVGGDTQHGIHATAGGAWHSDGKVIGTELVRREGIPYFDTCHISDHNLDVAVRALCRTLLAAERTCRGGSKW